MDVLEKLEEQGTLPKQFFYSAIDLDASQANAKGVDLSTLGPDDPVPIRISSETPVSRFGEDWILSHAASAVDMTRAKRGLSLLVEHGGDVSVYTGTRGRIDPKLHIGLVDNIRLVNRELWGDAHFEDDEFAQRIRRGVIKGTRRFVSGGWQPMRYRIDEAEVNGVKRRKRTWTRWMPDEVSIVSIGADPTAGVGHSADGNTEFPVQAEEGSPMDPKLNKQVDPAIANGGAGGGQAPTADPAATQPAQAAQPTQPAQANAATVVEVRSARDKEVTEIISLCNSQGLPEKASEFIERGYSKEQASHALLVAKQTHSDAPPPPAELLAEIPEKERRNYRYTRALRNAVDVHQGKTPSGLEWEVSKLLSKTRAAKNGGILLPITLEDLGVEDDGSQANAAMANAMGTGVSGGGAELVSHSQGQLIDVFRASAMVSRMGARMLAGLTSPIEFGRATADPTVYHVGENPATPVPESQTTFDTVQLSPKTLQGKMILPKQLIQLASLDVESDSKRRLGIQHGLTIDRGVLRGVGGQFQPLGLLNVPGVQAFAMGGVPTYKKLVDMTALVADQDAAFGALGWLNTVPIAGAMMATEEAAASNGKFIWKGDYQEGRMANYVARSTTQMPKDLGAGGDEHGLVFGKWDEIVIGLFGVMEVLFNPYLLADYGQVQFNTWQMYDGLVQRPQAFVQATGAKPA